MSQRGAASSDFFNIEFVSWLVGFSILFTFCEVALSQRSLSPLTVLLIGRKPLNCDWMDSDFFLKVIHFFQTMGLTRYFITHSDV